MVGHAAAAATASTSALNLCTTTASHDKQFQLQDIPALNQSHCKIRQPERVQSILNEFINGGAQRLQVVSDFDYTITKQRTEHGAPVLSSFGIFNACKSLPDNYVQETDKLFHKYRPIEIDPRMPKQEKVMHMIDWWSKASELLIGVSFEESEIDEIAAKYSNSLRDHTKELLALLHHLNIPVLVFSAGLGNSVVSVLRQAQVLHPNMQVVSNFLQYKNGRLDGFRQPIIHTFNKNETVLQGSEYYDLVHNRDHIILMGDSIGDADMANGVPKTSHIIKIGFLFDHIEENLEKYMNTFDIVLIDDQTMNVPLSLLQLVAQREQQQNVAA